MRTWASGLLALVVIGCHREHRFESVCQLIRREVVEVDARGEPTQVDIELEWDPCPGDQFQVVRGDAAFARCMAKYDLGESLPVHVKHWWDSRGFYAWDVDQVGDCSRRIEPHSEGSFEKSQECHETRLHGVVNGFHCSRRPFERLVAVCPWLSRD